MRTKREERGSVLVGRRGRQCNRDSVDLLTDTAADCYCDSC